MMKKNYYKNKMSLVVLMVFAIITVGYSQTTINSLKEFMPYLKQDNVHVKLIPGYYSINESDIRSGEFSNPLFLFEGSNSTYDFTGVTLRINTNVFRAFGSVDVVEFQVLGNNNVLKNLTIEDTGDFYPTKRAQNIVIDGRDNRIEGFHVTARGSYPYGYGDAFGKGGSSVIAHKKHSVILVRGLRNHVKDCTVISRSYGHILFMQAASYPLIEGCYLEGEMRTTDDMLAEEGTGSAADNVDFMTVWGYKLPKGYMMSLQEGGIRAYNAGTTYIDGVEIQRGTDNPTVLNCVVKNARTGVTLAHASGTKYVDGCTVIGCEQGYAISSGTVINCVADAAYGPVYKNTYTNDNGYKADITIVEPENGYYNGNNAVAYIGGKNHDLKFTSELNDFPSDLKIMMAGELQNIRMLNGSNASQNNHSVTNVSLANYTNFPVLIHSEATNSVVRACEISNVTNQGDNNTIIKLSCDSNNLALKGTATQSSTGYDGWASKAIDGNTNGVWSNNSVTHTATENNAWWQVVLPEENPIGTINIYGRVDGCCKTRLSNFTLYVYDQEGNETFTKQFTTYPDPMLNVAAAGVKGKTIKIVLNENSTALSLAEVEVFLHASLSISEKEVSKAIKVFPNPTFGEITVSKNSQNLEFHQATISLYDVNGQKVLEKKGGDLQDIKLNLSSLAKGVYFLKLSDENNILVKKVIKR